LDLPALRDEARTRVVAAPTNGDAIPSARPVLADALVDLAAMGMEVIELQAAREQDQRIIQSLIASLQAVGAQIERTPLHG